MMIKIALTALLAVTLTGCAAVQARLDRDPYGDPFYARYLHSSSQLDRQIMQKIEGLRQNPRSPSLQNDLGALLLQKGFPNDAERELTRAVRIDRRFYPAWYNLGLVRQTKGDQTGAMRAFRRTIALRPGHPAAHFQLGLLYEQRGRTEAAIHHLGRAFSINDALLDPRVNPRILDSKLVERALIEIYPTRYARRSAQFQATPAAYTDPVPRTREAPSRVPHPADIVTPTAPATERTQPPPAPPQGDPEFTLQPPAPFAGAPPEELPPADPPPPPPQP